MPESELWFPSVGLLLLLLLILWAVLAGFLMILLLLLFELFGFTGLDIALGFGGVDTLANY